MALHRRQVLTALGTTGVAALAGCPSVGGKHTTKLLASDGDDNDEFGWSVAMAGDGTTTLIGAPSDEDPNGEDAGAAYVFELSDGAWTQQAKLAADDGDSRDEFGRSVAMAADGTTALVGAPGNEDPNGEDAGAAYVFERSDGAWTQQAKLAPADGDSHDEFGRSVAMGADGTTALVGAPSDEDPNGVYTGAAYVFERSDGSWTQQAKLAPADGDVEDQFGKSVAMATDGGTAIVGAWNDEAPNGWDAGAAYVFAAAGGSWTQEAKLAADDGDDNDHFGQSVAVAADGTTALVGAHQDEDPNGASEGAAYVFNAAGGDWSQQAKLAPTDGDHRDSFGASVTVAADGTIAIIATWDPGAAYVFERADGSWTQQAKLVRANRDEDEFGSPVAVADDGTTALVGARRDEKPDGERAGAAYVFERSDSSWLR